MSYATTKPSIWASKDEKISRNTYLDHYAKDVKTLIAKIQPKKEETLLRAVTMNVHFRTDHKVRPAAKAQIAVLKKIDADVVMLQECTPNSKDILDLFPHHAIGNAGTQRNIICSKHPIENIKVLDLVKYEVERCAVICEIKGITFVCLHLDVFDLSGETRKVQIEAVLSELESRKAFNGKVVVAGDFNELRSKDYNKTEREWITQHNIDGNFPTASTDLMEKKFKPSFFRLKYSVWTGKRVDYVWYRGIKPVDRQVVYSTVSDHFPLVVDFEI